MQRILCSNIYSLGVIIIKIVTGSKKRPNINNVSDLSYHCTENTPFYNYEKKSILGHPFPCFRIIYSPAHPVLNGPFFSEVVRNMCKMWNWTRKISVGSFHSGPRSYMLQFSIHPWIQILLFAKTASVLTKNHETKDIRYSLRPKISTYLTFREVKLLTRNIYKK
jgi:hypothetical protein